jgi:UDP-N-acetyl-2-amino-2-deoxyglucuronate dehydrogenase
MLNLAVIGCGVIAQFHLRALAKLTTARAAAVCDVRAEVAQKTAAEFNVPRWTTNAAELFADPTIDAVILALPANLRTALALEAFKNGKHVLTEKPVAMNAAEVRTMLAAQGDRVGAVCSSRYHYFASARAARDFLRSGALGSLRTITCRGVNPAGPPFKNPPAWRLRKDLNGGGIFVNWGCYDLDYLFGLLDFKLTPQFALARTWPVGADYTAYTAPGSDAETHVTALITFAEGCVLNYERAEFSTLPPDNRWQITGERGTLTLQMLKAKTANVVLTEPDAEKGTRTRVLWEGDESALTSEHDGVAADFVAAILEKRQPQTSLQDALLFARVADAIYASSASAKPAAFD